MFQILFIVLLAIIVIIGSLLIPKLVKAKTSSKQHDHIVALLLSAFAVATYFSVVGIIPEAFSGDHLVTQNKVEQVDQEHVRAIALPLPYKINEYELQSVSFPVPETYESGQIRVQTTDFTELQEIIQEDRTLLRDDRSIDMASYYNQVILPAIEEAWSHNESYADQERIQMTIERLSSQFHQHDFTYVE